MYRFALKPWWIVSHIVVIAIAVLFINLGIWQIHRHDERAEQNDQVMEHTEQPAVAVGDLVGTGTPSDLRYRPVTATGTYVADMNLLVDNRSYEGLPGAWVVTPLRLADGRLVAVSRGFLPASAEMSEPPPAPSGEVAVVGTAVEWDDGCGRRTNDAGEIVGAACLSRDAMSDLAGEDLLDLAMQAQGSEPSDDPILSAVPLPELDSGPHLSYAGQWFLFTLVGLVTYPLILRRVARHREIEPADDEPADDEAGVVGRE